VIKEAALFFESGSSNGVHKIIGVTAPKHLKIQRVIHTGSNFKRRSD
jgi:dephospho-CoA kinase